jgi:tRNA-splicing ligase RtcB
MKDKRLKRLDENRLNLDDASGVPVTVFANEDVPIEKVAVDELSGVLELKETIERIAEADKGFFEEEPGVLRVAATPDFHKGAGIPVGTVLATRGFCVPQAIGNDVNCGMRLHATSLSAEKVRSRLDELETACRHAYFEGGRDIRMTRKQRERMFKSGMEGLVETTPRSRSEGLWGLFHDHMSQKGVLDRMDGRGSRYAGDVAETLRDFLGGESPSRDAQIGSIGGGNHFVEFQQVEKVHDKATAYEWGLKVGQVVVMVHTGSVAIGHAASAIVRNALARGYPRGLKHPKNGIFVLPSRSNGDYKGLQKAWDAVDHAANFAFANRMFLALMAVKALRDVYGGCDMRLLYDAPHNMMWPAPDGPYFIHRKGACPALGPEEMKGTPFSVTGQPVMVPGSMGSPSFVLAGLGNQESLFSASHGAGRALSRGGALKVRDGQFEAFMRDFRVVTPVDFRRQDIRMRRDIMEKKLEDIRKEAPYAYKGIGPVIDTLVGAGLARTVAELRPILTVKG